MNRKAVGVRQRGNRACAPGAVENDILADGGRMGGGRGVHAGSMLVFYITAAVEPLIKESGQNEEKRLGITFQMRIRAACHAPSGHIACLGHVFESRP